MHLLKSSKESQQTVTHQMTRKLLVFYKQQDRKRVAQLARSLHQVYKNIVSISGGGNHVSFIQKRSECFCDSSSLVFNRLCRRFARRKNNRSAKQITYFHLLSKVRMYGATLPLPQHASMASTGTTLPFINLNNAKH